MGPNQARESRLEVSIFNPGGQILEAVISAADSHGPLRDRLTALIMCHRARRLNPLECSIQEGMLVAHHDERPATEKFVIIDRIGMPKIVLAMAIA